MTRLVSLWNRITGASRREREAAELEEEMRFHREMLERDASRAGLSPMDARYAARRQFGNTTYMREESGDMWRIQPVETFVADLKYAFRFLRRSPAFTIVAVASLALGIGANSAVFTLINAIIVRTLPVHEPDRLVLLEPSRGVDNVQQSFPHPYFRELDSANTVFDGMFAVSRESGVSIDRGSGAEPLPNFAALVSGKFFTTLGVRPAMGRLLGPSDDITPRGHPVVVISHELWRQSFGGDTTIVGKSVRVNGVPMTIVGVAPEGFQGMQVGEKIDLYIPLLMAHVPYRTTEASLLTERGDWWLYVVGRLKPGVTRERAATEMSMQFKRILLANPPFDRSNVKGMAGLQLAKVNLSDASSGLAGLRRRFERPLIVLAGMAAVVLLIACTNLASLLSARAAARRKEIAIRLSMGAARGRLLRQLLTESLLLSTAGAVLGVALAYLGAESLLGVASRGRTVPLWITLTPDWRVLGFTAAVATATAILFGIAPALQATKLELAPTLRSGGAAGRGRSTMRLGKLLIATQVALSVLLVFGASLFTRSLERLYATDVGFDRNNVVAFRLDPRRVGYKGAAVTSFHTRLLERARTLPGVTDAVLANHIPFSGSQSGFGGRVEGYTPPPDEMAQIARVVISDDYFRMMKIALRSGRLPTADDAGGGGGPRYAVVNESFVKAYVPSGQPLGKHFYRGGDQGVEIVGVVADVKFNNFRDDTPPIAYWTYTADTASAGPAQVLFVRIDPKVPGVINSVRALFASLDRNVEILGVRQLEAVIDLSISNERIVAGLSGFFGAFALVLAMIGLYGLMAYAVTSRTREIGIRIALGAETGRVAWSVLSEAMVLVAIGLAVGIPAALVASKVGQALLYGMTPTDVPTMVVTAGLLAIVATAAAAIPAWRASRIDPVGMLRTE